MNCRHSHTWGDKMKDKQIELELICANENAWGFDKALERFGNYLRMKKAVKDMDGRVKVHECWDEDCFYYCCSIYTTYDKLIEWADKIKEFKLWIDIIHMDGGEYRLTKGGNVVLFTEKINGG